MPLLHRVKVDARSGDSATRVDPKSGAAEELEFIEVGSQRIFGCRYVPPTVTRGHLLIVPSIHAELLNAYRLEVLLARAMARSGSAVQRFHYRGSGHSDGDSAAMSFDSMVEDALAAARRLVGETGASPTFLGTRMGALVAAAAARRFDDAPLVLWEPVTDADRYFRESYRARKIRNMGKEAEVNASSGSGSKYELFVEELMREGVVDVLGYPIDRLFFSTLSGRTLVAELGDHPRTILLCQVGRTSKPRGDYERAIARWRTGGFDVHLELIQHNEISWLQPDPRKRQGEHQPLIDLTADWLNERNRNGGRR